MHNSYNDPQNYIWTNRHPPPPFKFLQSNQGNAFVNPHMVKKKMPGVFQLHDNTLMFRKGGGWSLDYECFDTEFSTCVYIVSDGVM